MTTELASTTGTRHSSEIFDRDQEAVHAVASWNRDAKADSNRRAYASVGRHLQAKSCAAGRRILNAALQTVANQVRAEAET